MKSYIVTQYGKPEDVVSLKETEKPVPRAKQVLIKVKAAPINDYDWTATTGKPTSYRLLFGISKPKKRFQKPGMEVAGVIEAIGAEVTSFKVGDAVYGDLSNHEFGSLSEYLCVNEKALALKPEKMSFEEAASIPHASMLAYEGLIDAGNIQPNQKILINGAGGGMGTFAIQIAKTFNAKVTAVDSGPKEAMLRKEGAVHFIDYQKEAFTKSGTKYDLILDPRTNRPPWKFLSSLKKGGRYVTVGGQSGKLIQILLLTGLIRFFTGKRVMILGLSPNKYLDKMNELYDQGIIQPVIDGPHPFTEVPRLIQYFGDARHQGKVVIAIP